MFLRDSMEETWMIFHLEIVAEITRALSQLHLCLVPQEVMNLDVLAMQIDN